MNGYLIGVNRETHKFEELSTLVHKENAENFIKVETELNASTSGGIHAKYYNISFVKETDMEYVRELRRVTSSILFYFVILLYICIIIKT